MAPTHRSRRPWRTACDLAILATVCVLGSGRAPDRPPAGKPDLSPYSAHVYLYRDFDGAPFERITIDIADGEGRVRYERLMDEHYVREDTMTRPAVALLRPALVRLLSLGRFPIGYTGGLHVVVNGREWTSLSNAPPRPGMPHEVVELASDSEIEEGLRIEGQIVRAARKATGLPEEL